MEHKYDQKLNLIEIWTKNEISRSAPSMIKCAAGINHYGNRIKNIYKISTTEGCSMCDADQDWEHAIARKEQERHKKELKKKLKK